MKRVIALICAVLVGHAVALADELVKRAQEELKTQGFYFGEVTGLNGPETTAAVRRYQIRNGLEVTGTLTKETLVGLGMQEKNPPPPVVPAEPEPAPAPAPQPKVNSSPASQPPPPPPVNLRRNESIVESDQNFLRREEVQPPGAVAPPAGIPDPSPSGGPEYAEVFFRTPFEAAPAELQRDTLKKAQIKMAAEGMYYGMIDGKPGPDTEEGVLMYQRRHRLSLSGRLDLPTLETLRLLPGRGGPLLKPFRESRGGTQQIYRGTIVR